MKKRMTQPAQPGRKRKPRSSGLIKELDAALTREAARWNVSKSFVIATALAYALNVKEQPKYDNTRDRIVLFRRVK